MSSLALRLRTSMLLLVLTAGALALRETASENRPWQALVLAASAIAVWEWTALMGWSRAGRIGGLLGAAAAALALAILPSPVFAWAFYLTLAFWGVALLRVVGVPLSAPGEKALFGMLGLLAIPVAGLVLASYPASLLPGAFLWAFLLIVILADSAAYLVGGRFGRTALAPEISPNKTRAGLGGALGAVAVAGPLMAWGLELPKAAWFAFVCMALLTGCASVVGDLTMSLLKRRAQVKDSGALLPGHGGMIDRVDGMLAAAPVFAMGMLVLHAVLPA